MRTKKYTSASISKGGFDNSTKLIQANFTHRCNKWCTTYTFRSYVAFGGFNLYKHSHYYCYSGSEPVFYRKVSFMASLFLYYLAYRTIIQDRKRKIIKNVIYFFIRSFYYITSLNIRYMKYRKALKDEKDSIFGGIIYKVRFIDYFRW